MTKLTDEDKALFANATQGVASLKTKVVNAPKKLIKKFKLKQQLLTELTIEKSLFNESMPPVSAHQSLFFQQPGVRKQEITNLKKGLLSIDITEDLHGKTEVLAENSIHAFIQEATHHQCKYGLLVHGKGYNSNSEKPILKNLVNQILTGHPAILAFCSAKPKDGGVGAVYIMFKLKNINNRSNSN